jgi:hypothetical protein
MVLAKIIKKLKAQDLVPFAVVLVVVVISVVISIGMQSNDWIRIDQQADLYTSRRLCEMDWPTGCKLHLNPKFFVGPSYRGQAYSGDHILYASNRPKTSNHSIGTYVVRGGEGCYKEERYGGISYGEMEFCKRL